MIKLGEQNNIHSSCIIGGQGFSFTKDEFRKPLTSFKDTIIGDENYIASFCNIDNGIYDNTVIGNRNIIDSHVHISHDVKIGNGNEIDAGVILLGHVEIENNCRICTGAIIHPKVKIKSGSVVGANSYLRFDLEKNQIAYGSPAKIITDSKYGEYLNYLR